VKALRASLAALLLAWGLSPAIAAVTTLTVTAGSGTNMLEGQQTTTNYLFPIIGISDPNNSTLYASVTAWGAAGSYGLGVNADVLVNPIEGTVADTPCAYPATSANCSLVAVGKGLINIVGATGFAPANVATPLSVTSSSGASAALTGSVQVVTNVGSANGAYCIPGATATTSDNYVAPNGGFIVFAMGANTTIACITSTGTTTVNIVGGTGFPIASGGGGGGSGGASGTLTNPSATITLSSTTTAYATGQLLCSSATYTTCNTSIGTQTFAIANTAGGASIPRLRVYSNDTSSTAWANAQLQIDLWTAAPTLGASGGDRAAFLANMATGSASHYASFSCTFSAFAGDGFYSECAPLIGNAPAVKLASGTSIYVTAIDLTASGTVTASKAITVVPEIWN